MQTKLLQEAKANEAAALASMWLDRSETETVRTIVRADDFGADEHKFLFECIESLADEDASADIDIIRMRDWLAQRDLLDAVGGVEYIVRVGESVPTAANAAFYARAVRQYADRRRLAEIGEELVKRSLLPDGADVEQIQAKAIKSLTEGIRPIKTHSLSLADALGAIDLINNQIYVSTGLPTLDGYIVGFGRGQMIVIAGRPGMGKTALMAESALRIAEHQKKRVLFFSMEMTAADIGLRLVCSRAALPLMRVLNNYLAEDERELFESVRDYLKRVSIRFDCGSLTPSRLRAEVLAAKRRGECDIAFVDYLGLMGADGAARSKYETTTDISNSIKRLAMDADVPIVVGCQLNRMNELRNNKKPSLADLRDSGAIEQDADIVLMLHRPHYYDNNQPSEICECLIQKNRRGATGMCELGFTGIYTRF